MGGTTCLIIIDGGGVQGDSGALAAAGLAASKSSEDAIQLAGATTQLAHCAAASCQLVDYLERDEGESFKIDDAVPIQNFHSSARIKLAGWTRDLNAAASSERDSHKIPTMLKNICGYVSNLTSNLDQLNRGLAAKYNRPVS